MTEEWKWQQSDDFLETEGVNTIQVKVAPGIWKTYHFFCGLRESAALFALPFESALGNLAMLREPGFDNRPIEVHSPAFLHYAPTIEDLLWCLENDLFHLGELLYQIEFGRDSLGDIAKTLSALSVASRVYKLLPDATVAIATLDRPLASTHWAQSMYHTMVGLEVVANGGTNLFKFDPILLKRGTALSCVAYLESGYCDIPPSILVNVFALSSGDSIYISMPVSNEYNL
jgi:hypothetical protein